MFAVSDMVEVKNGIYREDNVIACGVPDNSSTALTIMWLKDGVQIHSDERRTVSEHQYLAMSTVNFEKIGNKWHELYIYLSIYNVKIMAM